MNFEIAADITPEMVLEDRSTSFWLRDALSTALLRDPVDSLSDAEVLVAILRKTPEVMALALADRPSR
jgi:hypothetical protein